MSWPQWPGGNLGQPGIVQPPVINPAPNVVNPATNQYTPEQWAQMQHQNWQQWAQWQQQFQQWQQQYGAEYQKSVNAMTQVAIPAQASVPFMPAPPLPTESKPPPPPDEPVGQTHQPTNASYGMNVPPPSSHTNYNIGPQHPSPQNIKQGYDNKYSPYRNNPHSAQGSYPNQDANNQQRYQRNQNYNNREPQGQNWQNQNRNQQGPNRFNQPPPRGGPHFDNKPEYGAKRPYFNPNENENIKRNKIDLNEGNKWGGNKIDLNEGNKWGGDKIDLNEEGNKWGENQPQQPKKEEAPRIPPQPKPPVTPAKSNPEELSEAEKKFDKQFNDWEAQFQKWKRQNANHPDKEQYRQYEKKWETWRAQLLERREQMKRKRLGLTDSSPQTLPNKPDLELQPKNLQPSNTETPIHPAIDSNPEAEKGDGMVKLPPNLNNQPLEFKKSGLSVVESSDQQNNEDRNKEDEVSNDFLKSSASDGIPGLDLVETTNADAPEEDVVEKKSEAAKPDLEAISRGINSILGDQKLLDMLSIVQNKAPPPPAKIDSPKFSPTECNQDEYSNEGRDELFSFEKPSCPEKNPGNQPRPDSQLGENYYEEEGSNSYGDSTYFSNRPDNLGQAGNLDKPNFNKNPNFMQNSMNTSRGSGNFSANPNTFNRMGDNYDQDRDVDNYSSRGSLNENRNRPNMGREPNQFNRGFDNFSQDRDDFDGSSNYNNDLENFGRGDNFSNVNRGPDNFNRPSDGFNKGLGNFKGPGNRGLDKFNRGPDNFNRGPDYFNRGPDNFNREPDNFNREPENSSRGPDNFNRGPDNFNRGPDNFNRGPDNFNRGPDNFNRGPDNFNRGPDNFNRGSDNFNRGPDSFNRGPDNFNRGLDNFNTGLRGPGNFNRGHDNHNRGIDNFNRGPGNFNRDDNFNRGPGDFMRGPDNFRDGDGFGRDQNNFRGSGNFKGPGSLNKGNDSFNRGPGSTGRGTGSAGRGPSSIGRGPDSVGRGPDSIGRGPSSIGRGPEDFGDGPDEFTGGPDDFDGCPDDFGDDSNNYGDSQEFDKDCDNFGEEDDNFDEGPDDFNDRFNRPPDNFNRGPDNFNKGSNNSNRDTRNFDNFNKGPDNANRGNFDNFNRLPPSFDKGPNINRLPSLLSRDNLNFNSEPEGFGRTGNVNRDFSKNLDKFGRGPENFNNRGPDNRSIPPFNRPGDRESENFDDYNRRPPVPLGGPNSFTKGPPPFNKRPDFSGDNMFNTREDEFDEDSWRDNEPLGDVFDSKQNVNDNFDSNSYGRNSEDLNVGPSKKNVISDLNFEPPGTASSNEPLPNKDQSQIQGDGMWKTTNVIDYSHKSLSDEPEIILEIFHSFDYRHKPLNRIPYPSRPTWLSEMVGKYPEFARNLRHESRKYSSNEKFESYSKYENAGKIPYSDRDRGKMPYDDRGKAPYDDRGKAPYDDRGKAPYDDHGKAPYDDWSRRNVGDRDRKFVEDRKRKPYEDRDRYDHDEKQRHVKQYRTDKGRRGFDREYEETTEKTHKEIDNIRSFDQKSTDSKTAFSKDKRFDDEDDFESKDLKETENTNTTSDKETKSKFDNKNTAAVSAAKSNITSSEDILSPPGRYNRPPRIVIILRGPPGSGKSFLAKLIKDKEVENGGSAPRILCLDDYFMVEQEKELDEDGRKTKIKEMVYEYEEEMEASYRQSLMKSFKKTITDGYFPFIIVDNINDKVKYFGEMWSFAKQNGFQVYICQMELDVQNCTKRNIHGRSEAEIEKCVAGWEPTPSHHPVLDATSLIQSGSIPEVEMEEIDSPSSDIMNEEERLISSKWDTFDYSVDNLAKLDGTNKPLRTSRTMEDYLQLGDDWIQPVSTKPGQKRVRWADLEERKEQEKMRAIGFVVGQTNWDRMMDPTMGGSALTQTKYIERYSNY